MFGISSMADIIYILFFPEAFSLDSILRGPPAATPCRTSPTPSTPMPATAKASTPMPAATNASGRATGGNLIAYNLGERGLVIFDFKAYSHCY